MANPVIKVFLHQLHREGWTKLLSNSLCASHYTSQYLCIFQALYSRNGRGFLKLMNLNLQLAICGVLWKNKLCELEQSVDQDPTGNSICLTTVFFRHVKFFLGGFSSVFMIFEKHLITPNPGPLEATLMLDNKP